MKKSKNIYDLLNEIDFDIEDYEKEELKDIEKKKMKKNFNKSRKKKYNFKKIVAIAAALLLTVGVLSQTSLGKDVYARAESKISEISYSIGRVFRTKRDITPYSEIINQTVEDNGVEIKLLEFIIDKDEFIFSTVTDTGTQADMSNFEYDIFINGKILNILPIGGGTITASGPLPVNTHTAEFKDTDIDIDGDLDIKIVLRDLTSYTVGDSIEDIKENSIEGKWEFEFRANGSELTANTYSLPLDYSFNLGEQKYQLEEFRYNPVNQKIYGTSHGEYELSHFVKLMGYDDLGNKVEFGLHRYRHKEKEIIFNYDSIYNEGRDLSDNAELITLAPYAVEFSKEKGINSNNYKHFYEQVGKEFTISLKELSINNR